MKIIFFVIIQIYLNKLDIIIIVNDVPVFKIIINKKEVEILFSTT